MRFTFLLLCIAVLLSARAQDSLMINLPEAESIFLKENLILLAEQYHITAKEALLIQAKAYPNPVFSADVNAYNPPANRFFHADQSGQKAFSVEQLVLLGGKRSLEIEIARQNKAIAEAEFSELLRTLKKELHNSFFNLNQWQKVIRHADHQLRILDTIIFSFEEQSMLGNIPVKDVVRLKSVYLKINAGRSALSAAMIDEMKKMQLLLHSSKMIVPQLSDSVFDKYGPMKTYDDLLQIAFEHRPDFKIANGEMAMASLHFQLQKRMLVPDVLVNVSYDQRGGAFNNQVNAGVRIPLPLWDQNRGNIKSAGVYQKETELYLEQKKLEIASDVGAAHRNMQRSIEEYNKMKSFYNRDFNEVFNGMNENFQKKNITILEFVDFFEAYMESIREFERVKAQLGISAAQVNYVSATSIY
ncbi:MAG: TolC family protein [Flavobacteriales bacterium]